MEVGLGDTTKILFRANELDMTGVPEVAQVAVGRVVAVRGLVWCAPRLLLLLLLLLLVLLT